MSGYNDIISFDLRHGAGAVLDVASMYPISDVHAIRSTKPILDTLRKGDGKTYDFSLSHKLSIKRFRTIVTLDLSTPELWQPSLLTTKVLQIRPRFSTIDLVPPLRVPYGALDIRKEEPISSMRTYPDIYARKLPTSLHLRREWKNTVTLLRKHRRPLAATMLIIFSLAFPALWYTKYLIEDGYRSLLSLKDARDTTVLIDILDRSRGDFERANILFAPFRILPGEKIDLAQTAIETGLALTRGLSGLSESLPEVESGAIMTPIIRETDTDSHLPSYRGKAKDISPLTMFGIDNPTTWASENRSAIEGLQKSIQQVHTALDRIKDIEDPRKSDIIHLSATFSGIDRIIAFYLANESDILKMLGHDEPQRYIVLNQNRDEIRANGGFPGSVITFTLYKGNILDYRNDDVYYYDWNLYPYKEIPPPGLTLLTDTYGLRDVNYYPDFRTTLEKANDFVERSGDATLTTGIAIHQGIVEDILRATGPITLSGITEPFTAENFSPLMSTLVEARHGEKNNPKDILFDFISALAIHLHENRSYDIVLSTIEDALKNREIIFASRDTDIDIFLSKFRTEMPWTNTGNTNWAYPLLTSVSGNKSDRFIHRLYTADSRNLGECKYENKVTFTHQHEFSKNDEKDIERYMDMIGLTDTKAREKMRFIQGNGRNRTYMRLYVPKGSTLVGSAIGIDTTEEADATVFSWILETPVGASASKTLRYTTTLPRCDGASSQVTWYRQPGLANTQMK